MPNPAFDYIWSAFAELHRRRTATRSGSRRTTISLRIPLLLAIAIFAGCAGQWRRPVSDTVVASRQMAFRGMEAESSDRWEEAEGYYQRAIQECPANEHARRRYADALWRRDQRNEALAQMAEAVRLSGGDPEMMVELGRMYLAVGNVNQAEELADKAISVDQQRPQAWALRGDVNRQQGDISEALASYHRALSYRADYPEVQLSVAALYRSQGKSRRALSTLDAIVDHLPPGQASQDMLHARGLALADLGRHQEAAETLLAASKREAPTGELLYHLGEAQIAAGDLAAARLTLSEAMRRGFDHEPTKQLLAKLNKDPSHVAAAIDHATVTR